MKVNEFCEKYNVEIERVKEATGLKYPSSYMNAELVEKLIKKFDPFIMPTKEFEYPEGQFDNSIQQPWVTDQQWKVFGPRSYTRPMIQEQMDKYLRSK